MELLELPQEEMKFTHHVALDLGSDSIAACYVSNEIGNLGRSTMLNLQAQAHQCLSSRAKQLRNVQLRYQADMPRLKTRIALIHGRQPAEIEAEHAVLDFFDNDSYNTRCLFQYFFIREEEPLGFDLLPNPKIPFQVGANDVFPQNVRTRQGTTSSANENVKMKAELLLQHLATQIVRNFVLRSADLANTDPAKIHLTVTVPNVYSLSHKKSIQDFLQKHTGIGHVEIIYESDAIAYFVDSDFTKDEPTRQFIQRMHNRLQPRYAQQQDDGRNGHSSLRLLTIDVGRGTTDLSLIEISPPVEAGDSLRHVVKARTGKSEGGNTLSHLFARYYNTQLKACFERYLPEINQRLQQNFEMPFDLCALRHDQIRKEAAHADALSHLEILIEEVKESFTADYINGLSEARQRELLRPFAARIIRAISEEWRPPEDRDAAPLDAAADDATGTSRADTDSDTNTDATVDDAITPDASMGAIDTIAALDWLYEAIQRKLLLPVRVDPPPQSKKVFRELVKHWVKETADVLHTRTGHAPKALPSEKDDGGDIHYFEELRFKIRSYVQRNINDLIADLAYMAASQDKVEPPTPEEAREALKDCWIIVAGQASQFAPIHDCIEHRTEFGPGRLHFLTGAMAKNACCLGALQYKMSANRIENDNKIFGVYGFLNPTSHLKSDGGVAFKPVSSTLLNRDGQDTVTFKGRAFREFVYTPRVYKENFAPQADDGMTARLMRTSASHQYVVRYDPETLTIKVDNEEIRVASYGDTQSDIWPKVWPDVLRPPQ